jgi:hypothetical protein
MAGEFVVTAVFKVGFCVEAVKNVEANAAANELPARNMSNATTRQHLERTRLD